MHWNKTRNEESFLTPESYLRVNNPRGILEYTGIQDYYLKRKVLESSTLPNGMLQLSKIAHHGYYCSGRFMEDKLGIDSWSPHFFCQRSIQYIVISDFKKIHDYWHKSMP